MAGNRPGDFTTRFTPTIVLDNDATYYISFNRIISMFFTWTNVNSGNNNQKIAFSKDNGKTFTDIDFAQGVWTYNDLDNYIKEKTKIIDSEGNEDYPITLTFDEPTFRVIITLETGYQLDLTKSDFNELIEYDKKILTDERNIGVRVQYCAKELQTNFDEIPGFPWLFEEISLETIFQRNLPAFS